EIVLGHQRTEGTAPESEEKDQGHGAGERRGVDHKVSFINYSCIGFRLSNPFHPQYDQGSQQGGKRQVDDPKPDGGGDNTQGILGYQPEYKDSYLRSRA